MKLSAISEELRKLAQSEGGTAVLGGTTYRILGNNPDQKFRPFKPETPIRMPHDIETDKRAAIALYGGTERSALATLRAQVDKLGDDMDADARKRAMRLIAAFERGHIVVREYPRTAQYSTRGRVVCVYDKTAEPTLRISRNDEELFNKTLGRDRWGMVVTPEELAKLSETFIIHTV